MFPNEARFLLHDTMTSAPSGKGWRSKSWDPHSSPKLYASPPNSQFPIRSCLKSMKTSNGRVRRSLDASEDGLEQPRGRGKSVNFWLDTPYQTLTHVRSHCLVGSHGSTDSIHLNEAELEEIRDATISKAVYNILFRYANNAIGHPCLLPPDLFVWVETPHHPQKQNAQ